MCSGFQLFGPRTRQPSALQTCAQAESCMSKPTGALQTCFLSLLGPSEKLELLNPWWLESRAAVLEALRGAML